MIAFSRKAISRIEPLGEKLRRLRTEARVSLEALAQQTGIQPKYLVALEAGQYDRLPGDVYIRNFLRLYAATLHVNAQRVFELYEQERTVIRPTGAEHTPPRALTEPHTVNVHRLLKRLAIGVSVLALLAYLGLKVRTTVTPPALQIVAPAQDFITHQHTITIEGVTEAESTVRINGQQVFTDPAGRFSEEIDLQPGLNVIKIAAQKQRSREHVVYRQVLVQTGVEDVIGTTGTDGQSS